MKNMPQPIPYQGSKRLLAKYILSYFPVRIDCLYEPFAGSAAITIASAYYKKAKYYIINDLNKPLMHLLSMIINDPESISGNYQRLWKQQLGHEKEFYKQIRDEFNKTHRPDYLLYLLARGVKGAIRYNANGEYNQSPDNRRLGKNPSTMRKEIVFISTLLKNKSTITNLDYRQSTSQANQYDLVYLDPPYQGVCSNRDSRYLAGINYNDLVLYLDDLNRREVPFILSYDGKTGDKVHGKDIPNELGIIKIEISAGRSTTSTLNGGNDITIESLYLSKVLIDRLGISQSQINRFIGETQSLSLSLFT